MITILGIFITFGLAILAHELGHFIVAKLGGFRVEVFSIGFGKRVFGIKRGDTDYRLSLIPFGGYVKMVGEEPTQNIPIQSCEFLSKPWWKRACVYLSGPLFNILFSFPIFIIVFMLGAPMPLSPNVVGEVEDGSLGEEAGIRVKDLIIEVNGKPIKDWYDFMERAFSHPSNLLRLGIKRDGERMMVDIRSDKAITQKDLGLYPLIPPMIGSIRKGYPADRAGLRVGDVITSLNGVPIEGWAQMTEIIHSSPGKRIVVSVRRGDKEFLVWIRPVIERIPGVGGEIGLIGIEPMMVVRRIPPLSAVLKGVSWVFISMKTAFHSLVCLMSGQASLRQIIGPVGIARMAGERVNQGFGSLLLFIGFLSINLGILNLLPIPMLDGGHILFCLIEGIRGRMIALKVQEVAIKIGLAIIVSIFVFVTINDIIRTEAFRRIREGATEFIRGLRWIEERQGLSR